MAEDYEINSGNSEPQNNTGSPDSSVSDIGSPQSDPNAKNVGCEDDTDAALESLPTTERDAVEQLLHTANLICTTFSTSGPLLYLLKQIVRRFGFSSFKNIVKFHPWLVPNNLLWTGEVCLHSVTLHMVCKTCMNCSTPVLTAILSIALG